MVGKGGTYQYRNLLQRSGGFGRLVFAMKHLAPLLLAAGLLPAGDARYARLGELEGAGEVQLQAAAPWIPALANLPLLDGSWVRTGAGARLEIELDEGSAWRLGAESLAELSDYTRLSTGQRVTLVSLDHGTAWFTGAPEGRDALLLAVPGAQVTLRHGARVRMEAREQWSQIAVIEGAVRFSSPAVELDVTEGQMVRVEPSNTARFFLYREISPNELDRWSEDRDKALASSSSAGHLPGLRFGLTDLDRGGTWIDTKAYGTIWKPSAPEGWIPFRAGKWMWYDTLGYTWVSSDAWGWLPFHYGRWMRDEQMGWFWVPGGDESFTPGDVYWLRGTDLAGWGPLAPGEQWTKKSIPQLYLNVHTTFARFASEALEIDPGQPVARPREPLATASFVPALPSPALAAARFDAKRPVLRAGSTRIVPSLAGVAYDQVSTAAAPPMEARAPAPPPPPPAGYPREQPPPPVVIVETPPPSEPPPPPEIYYPAPVYTGIVVVNPPERHRERPRPRPQQPPVQQPQPKPAATPPPAPPEAPAARGGAPVRHPERPPEPPRAERPAPAPALPLAARGSQERNARGSCRTPAGTAAPREAGRQTGG